MLIQKDLLMPPRLIWRNWKVVPGMVWGNPLAKLEGMEGIDQGTMKETIEILRSLGNDGEESEESNIKKHLLALGLNEEQIKRLRLEKSFSMPAQKGP